jgi:hypothetical protein
VAGALLLVAGLAAAATVGLAFERKLGERERLEAALQAVARPRRAAPTPESRKRLAESAAVEQELGVPWTRLLAELEAASRDVGGAVALLDVEPDPGKHVVRITAEVRSLDDALDYLERLQESAVLRYPMLESHEVRKGDLDRALRIRISAEWRT